MTHGHKGRERMKKLAVGCLALMAYVLLAMNPFATSSASADNDDDDKRLGQSDHALWGPGDTNLYCGVGRHREPWTLHISATTGSSEGTLTLTFRDGSAISYNIRSTSSMSATNAFGGVPFVDDVVQITPGGGVVSALASALVSRGPRDPFADDNEKDNFCLTKPGDAGRLPGGFPLFGSPTLP